MGQAKARGMIDERIAIAVQRRYEKAEMLAWYVNGLLDKEYARFTELRKKRFMKVPTKSELVERMRL
jgi:hypothetical protein